MQYVLGIDQGTSSTKAVVFDSEGKLFARGSAPLQTNYFPNGFVEQDPQDIYQNVLAAVGNCLADFEEKGSSVREIQTCGISNQRETFLLWDKNGTPLTKAVVWQCKRSKDICERWKQQGLDQQIRSRTGLMIDPYFSGSKLVWLYETDASVRTAIDSGRALFGTIDSWILYKLTHGQSHFTDYTNASRTLLFNLRSLDWDNELMKIFGLSNLILPRCRPSQSSFGDTDLNGLLPSRIEVGALIGDSHAAAFGEGCFSPGSAKATLGTGCSILMNVGRDVIQSKSGMVGTICWSTADKVQYALEGVIVTCGATIEWLKNELGLIADSRDTERMALAVSDNGGVYFVPAFSGLGAPHWQMNRKASVTGMTFGTQKNHIVRAALESIPYQIKDVITAMESDTKINLQQLMVNGGMSTNNFVIQFLADVLDKPVVRMETQEASALGAAYLAGLQAGIFGDLDHVARLNSQRTTINPTGNKNAGMWYRQWINVLQSNY